MKITLVLFVYLAFMGRALAWGDCEYEREIERTIDIDSVKTLYVEAGAGKLQIKGGDYKGVVVKATLCADDKEILAEMDVASRVDGENAHIRTEFPRRSGWGSSSYQATIDLLLKVPEYLVLDVEDSSGEAQVKGVAGLAMKDSSGELFVSNIAGDVSVLDSSGKLTIKSVGGNADVTDSSGGMYVSNVKGNFVVNADSSGEIEVANVGESVLIKQDSSGAIDVENVGGDFTVQADTSGGIRYNNVDGKVSLPD